MSHAIRLQRRSAPVARRAVAAIAGLWFVAGVLFGARHEASVAHVVDAASGAVLHAPHIVGQHTGGPSDIHGRTEAVDADDCAIVAALHQAAIGASPVVVALATTATPRPVALVVSAPRREGEPVYRLAPKTSPPAHA